MRGFGLRAPGLGLASSVMLACSSSSGGGAGAATAGDAGVTCMPGTLAIGGPLGQTPHGVYALSDTALTASGFSATLPAGGSVQLEWTGDATSGPVQVDGMIVLPMESTTQSWCVANTSTVRVAGTVGTLRLRVATGSDVTVEPNGSCVDVADGGGQVPVATDSAVACFALGS
ncbi:MAG TPA: hypothetical protein VF765_03650 [Polyangiaceae bacterium]